MPRGLAWPREASAVCFVLASSPLRVLSQKRRWRKPISLLHCAVSRWPSAGVQCCASCVFVLEHFVCEGAVRHMFLAPSASCPGTGMEDVMTVSSNEACISVASDGNGPAMEEEEDPSSQATFMEIYSPPRVARHVESRGFSSAGSFDIITGCDLLAWTGRSKVMRTLASRRPLFLVSSPPCTMYSELMRLWNKKKMKRAVRIHRQREADLMPDFGMGACEIQHNAGRFWVHEHPWRASSWKRGSVPRLLS